MITLALVERADSMLPLGCDVTLRDAPALVDVDGLKPGDVIVHHGWGAGATARGVVYLVADVVWADETSDDSIVCTWGWGERGERETGVELFVPARIGGKRPLFTVVGHRSPG